MKRLFVLISVLILTILIGCKTDLVKELTFAKPNINKDSLINLGIPKRIVNQYVVIRSSFKYQNKSFFIVDTRENLIFCFDKNGDFIAKSPTIDGFDKQTSDNTDEALKTWSEHVNDIGFKWDYKTNQYIDVTNQKRKYSHKLVYTHLSKTKGRFFPKGVYKITKKYHYNGFVGNDENTYEVRTMEGKNLALAIHSLYKSQYRINNMNNLVSLIGSDFDELKVSSKFKKTIKNNLNTGVYNNSFGCINVPNKFISKTKNYAVNSLVFVMGEDASEYTIK